MTDQERLQELVNKGRRLVFFGGAGVSTESGIPDFRSVDGLYRQEYPYPPEEILSHRFFEEKPEEFFAFYRKKMIVPQARPNAAHLKLAELERAGRLTAVVTQNIDGLHQMAGSKNVLELHGSVHRNLCRRCGKCYSAQEILHSEGVPRCTCGGAVKPDVVLYGECLDDGVLEQAIAAISAADCLIIGGTSLSVYPASSLVRYFGGAALVLINKSPTGYDSRAGLLIPRPIGEVLGALVVSA